MSFDPAASSETDWLRSAAFTCGLSYSSPFGVTLIAAWQSVAPLASSARACPYSVCIAATGIGGPAWAVGTLWASWAQVSFVSGYCRTPLCCKAVPNRDDTAARRVPPGPNCQVMTRLCMLGGRLSAPPVLATSAAEGMLPFALLTPRGAWAAEMVPGAALVAA